MKKPRIFKQMFGRVKLTNNKEPLPKNKKIIAIGLVVTLLVLVVGITYSLWTYGYLGETNTLQTGDVSLKLLESTSEIIDIKNALPKGDNEGKTQEETFNFAVTTTASRNTAISYSINIEKLEVDEGYTSLEDKDIKVYLEDYNNKEIVAPSLISNIGTKLYSKTNIHNSNNKEITDKYKLRVWLDKEVDISNWTKETKLEYKFKIGVTGYPGTMDTSGANKPVLDTNMIPVYYDETTETWKKADSSNENQEYKWYNYDEKMWANSVTVSEENRSKYLSADSGIEIPMEDILTMQVWIPRYKYKVWNYNADGTKTSNPQEIQITWEASSNNTSEITCEDKIQGENGDGTSETCKLKATNEVCTDDTCNNKTYTHPGFYNSDGFWIGKFELTGTINDITVKPNLSSVRNQNVSSFREGIEKVTASSNKYGLRANTSHMITNMEWGAVAYLSHSKYGTCTDGECHEIGMNKNSSYKTGCGAKAGSASSTTCNEYNTELGKGASTTGNIYGVYDMSGGAYEYTMANLMYKDGVTPMSGYSSNQNSGYTGRVYDSGNYTSYTEKEYPTTYIDKYSYSSSSRKATKLGDSIKEVYSDSSAGRAWYTDYNYFVVSSRPWFVRGSGHGNGSDAGVFASIYAFGNANSYYSARLAFAPQVTK